MTSTASEFKLLDRGFKKTLLLIPGWAADYRIFQRLDLDFNYLLPVELSISDFKERLIEGMTQAGLNKVSVFGWSLGAFLAGELIGEYPERIDDEIFLVSARIRYEKEMIEKIEGYVEKDRKEYLDKFYGAWFSDDEGEALEWFRQNLLKVYLETIEPEKLFSGLDYLAKAEIKPEGFKHVNVTLIHGERDKIAPIEEALEIKKNLPHSKLVAMEKTGHVPFLNSNFKNILHGSQDR